MNLTDTHLVLLSAAAQHDARLLVRPDHLRDKAARTLAAALGRAGLVEEVAVRVGQPHWQTADEGHLLGLRITGKGLIAIGLDPADDPLVPALQPQVEHQATLSPRPRSKQASVLTLLGREEGADINALIAATGWLPHTTRAALTRLRQRGYKLDRTRGADGGTVYRLDITPDATTSVAGEG